MDLVVSTDTGVHQQFNRAILGPINDVILNFSGTKLPCILLVTPQKGPIDTLLIDHHRFELIDEHGEYILVESSFEKELSKLTGDALDLTMEVDFDDDIDQPKINGIRHRCYIEDWQGF